MKLAASKVDFRSGWEVGVSVVFVVPADVTTEGVGVGAGPVLPTSVSSEER